MKKIAYLCSEYPAISHTFVFREIESLREEGFTIYPVSACPSANLHKMTPMEQQEAERTLVLKETSLLAGLYSLAKVFARSPLGFFKMTIAAIVLFFTGARQPIKALCYLAEAIILLDWLHSKGVSHIHEHFANPTAIVALLAKKYGGISYSLSVHGPDIFYQVDSSLLQKKVAEASFVRCISHYCRSQLWRISPYHDWSKFHIVRCGVDPDVYRPKKTISHRSPNLLCVGRLCPAKGQHILLEACELLTIDKFDFHLTFVGDGEDRCSLEALTRKLNLEKHVSFTGALGQDEVREYYRQADIFVLPSFAEGVPVVLMEAMAEEIPVISTRITGIPELIEHRKNGLLVTVADVKELAEELAFCLRNSSLRARLGREGRKQVVARYNQRKNNLKLASLFHQYGR